MHSSSKNNVNLGSSKLIKKYPVEPSKGFAKRALGVGFIKSLNRAID